MLISIFGGILIFHMFELWIADKVSEAWTEYLETKALPEIWLEKEKFLAAATKLQTATSNLAAVAKTGDAAKLKVAFGQTAKSCKACHDAYKE